MTPRPDNAPPADHPLLLAGRYLDAEAEDHELQDVVAKRGLSLEEIEYAAEQRAVRVVLMQNNRVNEISPTEPTPVTLNEKEKTLLDALVPVYVDAMLLGWRARELAEAEA